VASETSDLKLKAVIRRLLKVQPQKVKLFKLLYLVDFTAFPRLGRSITGGEYEKWVMGPVHRPLWQNYKRILEESRALSTSAPAKILAKEEIEIVEEVLTKYGQMDGGQLSKLTHAELPYTVTEDQDIIPLYLAAYRNFRNLTQAEANKVVERNKTRLLRNLRRAR